MALYYWVGGNGTWDGSSTTNWSLTSGGAGGAGVPTTGDDVQFNTASGTNFTVSFNGSGAVCRNINILATTSVTFGITLGYGPTIYGNASLLSAAGSGGYFYFAATGAATINVAAHTNISYLGFSSTGTYTLTGNIVFNTALGSTLDLNDTCTLNTSTFTITGWLAISANGSTTFNAAAAISTTTTLASGYFRVRDNATLNLTANITGSSGFIDLILQSTNTASLGASVISVRSADISSKITTSAGQTINVRDTFTLGDPGTTLTQTFRTINFTAGGTSPTASLVASSGGALSITAITAAAGVTPFITLSGNATANVTLTTITSGVTAAVDNVSGVSILGSNYTVSGANWTVGTVNNGATSLTLSGTITLNSDGSVGTSGFAYYDGGVTTSVGAITATRITGGGGAIYTAGSGAFTVTGTTNTTGRINAYRSTSSNVSFGTTTAFSFVTAGAGAGARINVLTIGALTLSGADGGGGQPALLCDAETVSLSSANLTANITTNYAVSLVAYSGSVTASGTITAGAVNNRGGVYAFSTTSTSLAAVNASILTIDAGTSAAHGLFTATYPTTYGAGNPIGTPVASVASTNANISCGGIDAQYDNFQLDSGSMFADYEVRGSTGNVTFSGAVTLGTATYRKGLRVRSKGTSSFAAITASWVDFTSPGNLTASGTITLSSTVNANSNSFYLNIGAGSTATFNAATTALSMTGVTAAPFLQIEGDGNVAFTTAVATTAGVITFTLANTGTTSFASAISVAGLYITYPACTFSGTTTARYIEISPGSGITTTNTFVGATTVTAGGAFDGGVRLNNPAYSSPFANVSFAALSCVYISTGGLPFVPQRYGNITIGALTVSGAVPSNSRSIILYSSGNVTIASINVTLSWVTSANDVLIDAIGNIAIAGAVDIGPAGGKGGLVLTSSTGSASHGACTANQITINAVTTVSQGAITLTTPLGSPYGDVISVTTGGNVTTGAITADFSLDTTSNYRYAFYQTTSGGAIAFGGTVSLGTTTYRKGLIATVSGGSGAISYAATNVSFINLTTPGNITGTGTVTLSCADAITAVSYQFLLDVGGTATNTAATTAVSTTGIPQPFFAVFRVQGTGNASFTNQITGNLGGIDYQFVNGGTISCAAVTGYTFIVNNGGNATFGAVTGTDFESYNAGTLTTGAITMSAAVLGSGDVYIASTGTATLNGALSCVTFYRNQGNLTLGAFTYAATQLFEIDPGYTLVPSTSTVSVGNASALNPIFSHGGYTYNAVNMTGRLGYVGYNVPGVGATSATFAYTGVADPHARAIFYGNFTVTGTGAGALSLIGNSLVNRLSVESYTAGTPITLSCGNTRVRTNVDFTDINGAGGTLPWAAGTSTGDCGGNTNIDFTPAQPRTAIASGNWDNTATWSGGILPLGQDPVTISSAVTLTVNNRRVLGNSIDMTGSSATISFAGNTYPYALVCGAVTIPSTVTINGPGFGTRLILSTRTNRVYTYAASTSSDVTLALYAPNTIVTQLGALSASIFAIDAGTWNTQTGGNVPDYPITANDIEIAFPYSIGAYGVDPITYGMAPQYAGITRLKCNSSEITYRFSFYTADSASLEANTSTIKGSPLTSSFAGLRHDGSGSFYNIAVEATNVASGVLLYNDITVTNSIVVPTTSTQPTLLKSNNAAVQRAINMTGATTPMVINTPKFIRFEDLNITLTPQVTTTQAKYKDVTITGTTLRAYGLANLGNNVNIDFVSALKTVVYSAINATYTVPNITELLITVVGGGGQGGKASTANTTAGGGGGGGVAVYEAFSGITPGSTIYVNAAAPTGPKTTAGTGNAGGPSWVNFTSNTAPLSSSQGARANGGNGGTAAGTGGTGGTGVYGAQLYTGGAASRGGGTANFSGTGYAGNVRGGAGTFSASIGNNGGAGLSGFGGTGGTSSARTPTAGGAGTNGGGGGGGGQVLQVRSVSQPASRANGSSLCTVLATGHGLLSGETANITFAFSTGSYSTGSFSNSTVTRNNGSTTLAVTTSSAHNLINGDTISIASPTFKSGSYATVNLNTVSITRDNGLTTCSIVTTAAHNLTNGDTINLVPSFRTGTYSRSGTLVTCNVTNHGLTNGQTYYIDFTSGAALDGSYVVTVVTSNQFRVTTAASGTTSGNLTIGGSTQLTAQNYTVTVTNPTTFTITTAQSTGFFSSVTSTVRTPIATCSVTSHGLTNGQTYYLDFTTGGAPDGSYVVTVVNSNSFTVNLVTTPNISGNVTLGGSSQLTTGSYTVTVTGATTFTVTTVQNTGLIATATINTAIATCFASPAGLANGQTIYIDFTSGVAVDGSYVVSGVTVSSFRINLGTLTGTSGNFAIGGSSQLVNGDYVVNVVNANEFNITTAQTTGVLGASATSVLVTSTVVGGAGGAGANYNSVNYSAFNNISSSGATGVGGAGGGGGGATLSSGGTVNYGKGGVGGAGGIGAGGGGGGSYGLSNPSSDAGDGGSGGAGLVIITYAAPRSVSRTDFIV
jgi:hypothetical protein